MKIIYFFAKILFFAKNVLQNYEKKIGIFFL
jgi:hypothetical protein